MVKIKGYRFECEVCQVKTSIQVFYRKDGQVGYSRARHLGADKKFYYHQQSLEYVNRKLGELSIEPCQGFNNKSIEQTTINSDFKPRTMAGGEGFEPKLKWSLF